MFKLSWSLVQMKLNLVNFIFFLFFSWIDYGTTNLNTSTFQLILLLYTNIDTNYEMCLYLYMNFNFISFIFTHCSNENDQNSDTKSKHQNEKLTYLSIPIHFGCSTIFLISNIYFICMRTCICRLKKIKRTR
jgi:hypothetical protein